LNQRSLEIRSPAREGRTLPLAKSVITIGRAEENHIVLDDADRKVSRRHAQINIEEAGAPILTDLNSANGTLVNGILITGRTPLNNNDVIGIGPHQITYRETAPGPDFSIETGGTDLARLQSQQKLVDQAGSAALEAHGISLLEILHEVSLTLARTQTVEEVKIESCQLLFKIDGVHRACVMLWDEGQAAFQEPEVRARGNRSLPMQADYDPRRLILSSTILDKVLQNNRPLLIRDVGSDQALSQAASIVRAGIQAAFCSPLTFQGRFLGVLYADNLASPEAFSESDFRTFTSIAAQTGLALANARARSELSKQQVERAAMRLYLPAQVFDLISATGGSTELGGTVQEITVLFADIRGFTTLSEELDAREVVQLLNEFFTAMSGVILQCGGTLDKFIGDCVMALFGAPVHFPDSPQRALDAATAMQRCVAGLNTTRAKRNQHQVKIGIGLHHGLAVVGNVGSADRMQYTAIGDTVNIAARLVSLAAPDQILVSGEMHTFVASAYRFDPLGNTQLKGRLGAIDVYSALWEPAGDASDAPG
jgi:adenylate cyclase